MVDDENNPAPENIPSPEPTQNDENENHAKAVWEFDGIDEEKKENLASLRLCAREFFSKSEFFKLYVRL